MLKQLFYYLAALSLLTACGSQSKSNNYKIIEGFAEGTTYRISYSDPQGRDLSEDITIFFKKFDKSLSIYDSLSLVSRINRGDTLIALDGWFTECFELSQQISRKSGGLLDITLRPLIAAYGFGGKEQMESVSQQQVDSMLNFVGYRKVRINDGLISKADSRMELDFNAVAKGYSVDLLGRMMDSLKIDNYLVEVGGEITTKGKNSRGTAWTIVIDTPIEGNYMPGADTQATLQMSGKGLATSGNYRKFRIAENGERIVHTIDPRTGKSAIHNLLSATIIAPTTGEADGFATACMVAGLDGAKQILADNPQLEALLIYSQGEAMKIYATREMQQRIIKSK